MRNFAFGTIFGIIVASVGFTGLAHILDKAVNVTKEQAAKAATKE